jgi:hypothetical protein
LINHAGGASANRARLATTAHLLPGKKNAARPIPPSK